MKKLSLWDAKMGFRGRVCAERGSSQKLPRIQLQKIRFRGSPKLWHCGLSILVARGVVTDSISENRPSFLSWGFSFHLVSWRRGIAMLVAPKVNRFSPLLICCSSVGYRSVSAVSIVSGCSKYCSCILMHHGCEIILLEGSGPNFLRSCCKMHVLASFVKVGQRKHTVLEF